MQRLPAKQVFLLWILIVLASPAFSQVNPYHINGNAYQENCNCYTITPDQNGQSGSVWNINKIDLTQSFDYKFDVFLGCADANGADGIVFVLQPISTNIGGSGGGLGYTGVTPSIGITIDTWQNTNNADPAFDHIAIHRNGDIGHASPNNLAGPVTAIAGNDNIEDCKWHTFRIVWDAAAKILKAQIDGVDRVQTTIDLVAQVFNNDPKVFWGFTGSTGGSRNHQRFCTSLTPSYALAQNQVTCFPTPIQFSDNSTSFGSIVKWNWNFGDGTTDSVQTPAPHVYPAPGNYKVTLSILGNDGCWSNTHTTDIVVGSKPSAVFGFDLPLPCEGFPLAFADTSKVQFGTINKWTWNINNGQTVVTKSSSGLSHSFNAGPQQIELTVQTVEGCVSDPVNKTFSIPSKPVIAIQSDSACINHPIALSGLNADPLITIRQWYWNLADGSKDSSVSIQHIYTKAGKYPVELFAISDDGCFSDTLTNTVTIHETKAFAGKDTTVVDSVLLQLNGRGGEIYHWTPSTGLSNPDIANPVARITGDASYILTASIKGLGCPSADTINIKVYKGPAIYVPNAFTPNNDGKNDRFRFIPAGITTVYFFHVYNRYGQLIYSSKDPQRGWDGTINGRPQPSGSYVWVIQGKDFNGAIHTKKGLVTLIR